MPLTSDCLKDCKSYHFVSTIILQQGHLLKSLMNRYKIRKVNSYNELLYTGRRAICSIFSFPIYEAESHTSSIHCNPPYTQTIEM